MYKYIRKYWGISLILLFSILPLLPLFHAGFFSMHDDTQVSRVFEMGKSLRDGMMPVRWVGDLGYGYGYPIFTFYAPLAYYVGGILLTIGIPVLLATKFMMGIAIVLSGVFMYLFAKSIWGEAGGVTSGILYLYAPYHALDIYVRGDVAEFWAYALLPLAFWGIYTIYSNIRRNSNSTWQGVLLSAIGYGGVILSHNLSALMITPFLALFILVLLFSSRDKLRTTFFVACAVVLALMVSAFYWLPVPFEMKYTNVLSQVGGSADFRQHFVCLAQLWNSPWGYGGSTAGCIDGISFALGKLYIAILALSLLGIPLIFRKSVRHGILLLYGIFATALSLFLLLPYSSFIWQQLHVLAFLQYPWRFLLLTAFSISFLGGALFWYLDYATVLKKRTISGACFIVIAGILIFVQGKYFVPQVYTMQKGNSYTTPLSLEWNASRITHEYMPKNFQIPQRQEQIVTKRFIIAPTIGTVAILSQKTQEYKIIISAKKAGRVHVNLAYFPGWHIFLNNREVALTPEKNGLSFSVGRGTSIGMLRYISTPIEVLGDGISIAGICIVILVIIGIYRKNIYGQKIS